MAAQGQTSLHDFFPTVRREPAFPVKRQLGSSALPSQLPSKKRKTLEQAQNSPFKSQTDLPKTVPVIQNVTPPSSPRKLKTPATPEPLTRGRMMVALARQKAGSSTPLGRQPGQSMRVRFSDKKMTARRRLLDDIHDHHDHTADPLLPAEKSVKADRPVLKEFGYMEFTSPTKKPQLKSNRACTLQLSEQHLPLPAKYRLLSERFHCTDTVVTMMYSRGEVCDFLKLKKAVQKMTEKQFEEWHLGQIKTVLPSAFIFRQKEVSRRVYQLTVEPNLQSPDLQGPSSSSSSSSLSSPSILTSNLVHRRRAFNKRLCDVVRGHHQKFLAGLVPPLAIPETEVHRWHKQFPLDSVPDIEPAELPVPPVATSVVSASVLAKDMLPPPPVEGIRKLDVAEVQDSALKGISVDLLNKIRAKEASRAKASITRDSASEKKIQMLKALPQMVHILRNYFSLAKKSAISWKQVTSKIVESSSTFSSDHVEEYLNYLGQVCSGWISFPLVGRVKYVKLNKKTEPSHILSKIDFERNRLLNT